MTLQLCGTEHWQKENISEEEEEDAKNEVTIYSRI